MSMANPIQHLDCVRSKFPRLSRPRPFFVVSRAHTPVRGVVVVVLLVSMLAERHQMKVLNVDMEVLDILLHGHDRVVKFGVLVRRVQYFTCNVNQDTNADQDEHAESQEEVQENSNS